MAPALLAHTTARDGPTSSVPAAVTRRIGLPPLPLFFCGTSRGPGPGPSFGGASWPMPPPVAGLLHPPSSKKTPIQGGQAGFDLAWLPLPDGKPGVTPLGLGKRPPCCKKIDHGPALRFTVFSPAIDLCAEPGRVPPSPFLSPLVSGRASRRPFSGPAMLEPVLSHTTGPRLRYRASSDLSQQHVADKELDGGVPAP